MGTRDHGVDVIDVRFFALCVIASLFDSCLLHGMSIGSPACFFDGAFVCCSVVAVCVPVHVFVRLYYLWRFAMMLAIVLR